MPPFTNTKSGELISTILGYEGEGSLLSKLKAEGLANSFGASADYTTDDFVNKFQTFG